MGCCCIQRLKDVDEMDEHLTDSRVRLTNNNEAQVLKEQGNDHFKKKAYLNAIRCYHQALSKNPNELVYYTNLALAYKANSQFQEAIKIIQRMNRHNFLPSPNYTELMAKGNVTKARCMNSLAKKYIVSNNYTQEQSQSMLDQVGKGISLLQQVKKTSGINVDEYLNNSLKIKIYLQKIRKKTSESQVIDYLKRRMNSSKKGLHNQKGWQKVKDFYPNQQTLLKQVQGLYSNLHTKFVQQAQEDEEYLIDPITYVIIQLKKQKFKQPVIVPSGISYEEDILRQYFKKGQYKDPITKEKFQVGEKVIIKNNSLKDYISEMGKIHEIKKEDIELLVC